MSELQNKVESAFKDSASQLKELNKRLENISDLEYEVTNLSNTLQQAASNLKEVSKKHSDYLDKVEELNGALREVTSTLSKIDPDKLEARLESLEERNREVKKQIKLSETAVKQTIRQTIYRLVIGVSIAALAGFYLLFM